MVQVWIAYHAFYLCMLSKVDNKTYVMLCYVYHVSLRQSIRDFITLDSVSNQIGIPLIWDPWIPGTKRDEYKFSSMSLEMFPFFVPLGKFCTIYYGYNYMYAMIS